MLRRLVGVCAVLLALYPARLASQEPNWVLKASTNSPTPRSGHAMAYDMARQEVVLFGGVNVLQSPQDTWVWNGTNWSEKSPAHSPPARNSHAMAYDALRGEVVLFGGSDNSSGAIFGDIWIWNGTDWTQRFPAHSPSPRYAHAMAYDSARGQVVLFGGLDNSPGSEMTETWVWDGTNWTQKFPANSPTRVLHAMAFDAAGGNLVLFGGHDSGFPRNDTWVWDGTNWTQKVPANVSGNPVSRGRTGMAYDALRGEVVLFGGDDFNFNRLSDTWVWNGTSWTQRNPANSPEPRYAHAMAYDDARGHVVLFGGSAFGTALNDTWIWPGDSIPPTGTISVTTNLVAGSFTISGPANYTGSGLSFSQSGAPAGIYTITYNPVNCTTAPVSATKTLAAGGTLTFDAGIYQGNGILTVTVFPAAAADATFTITPQWQGAPFESGGPYPRQLAGFLPQPYVVTFNNTAEYAAPSPQTATLSASCELVFAARYTEKGRLTIGMNDSSGVFTVRSDTAIVKTGFGPGSVSLPAGTYTVTFSGGSSAFLPQGQKVNLTSGQTTSLNVIYQRLFVVSFTGWNNAADGNSICPSLEGSGIT